MLQSYFSADTTYEAGCDEVGRGCLAGPVVAAAVILSKDFAHPLVRDSKKLNSRQREEAETYIKSQALAFAVAEVDHLEIDKINILNASYLAMHRAVAKLSLLPDLLLVDGNRFKAYPNIDHQCIVKGDNAFFSIAAASILAKNYRDALMCRLAEEFPHYLWEKNVGYPTPAHKSAILEHGLSPHHRRSFKVLNPQLTIFK